MADARKTTMGHITQEHLQQSTIPLPPNNQIANALETKLKPIFEEIILNYQQISKLQTQRDELLPLLMNGQVSVTQTAVNCDLVGLTISVIIAFSINLRNNISSHF
jgi:hypothetical protein